MAAPSCPKVAKRSRPEVVAARWPQHTAAAQELLAEYLATIAHVVDARQAAEELADLPARYTPPLGGLFLARVHGQWAGCCGFGPLPEADQANACEMKRLYVRPGFRRLGLGYALAEAVRDAAQIAGYGCMLLDTLDDMEAARALYAEMGFVPIAPYGPNPLPGAHHLLLML